MHKIKIENNKEYYYHLLKDRNVQWIINKTVYPYKYNLEDIRSECVLRVLESVDRYEYSDDFNFIFFLEFISKYLGRRVCEYVMKSKEIPLGDVSNIKDLEIENVDADKLDLKLALNKLSQEDKELIEKLYLKGITEQELGEEEGVSRQAINNKRRRIIRKLRKIMNRS